MAGNRKKKAMEKPDQKDLGRTIHPLRTERGLTQAQLAERTGLHVSDLSGLEKGHRNPTRTVLISLCKGLGINRTQLVDEAEAGGI